MTNWNGSSVMRDFQKIAEESGLITTNFNPENKDFVGNPSKSPVGPFRAEIYEYSSPKDYEQTKETGEELINKAHPKTIVPAIGQGDEGVVENQVEQQERDLEVANKMPSGALYGPRTMLIKHLIETADKLDEKGKHKEAQKIDDVIKKIAELPFENGRAIKKVAFFFFK